MVDGANYNITVKSQFLDQTCYARDNVGVINGADVNNIKIACGAKLSHNPFTYILSGSNAAPRINTYTVNFSANGSTDGTTPSSQTKTQDVTLVLSANSGTLIKTGYTFSGWNTAADGTGTDYAAGANYTNNTDITLYAKWTPALAIGDSYQGGKIAYIFQAGDTGYVAGETHGIIAATVNQSSGIVWAKLANQSSAVPGGTLSTIGSGATNTNNIITQNGLDSTYAAGIARSYAGGGYSDWYLPSLDELTKLFDAQAMIGNFTADYYWSSTEGGANTSWSKHFTGVSVSNQLKSTQWTYVRAVRSF